MAFLKRLTFDWGKAPGRGAYPFNVPALINCDSLELDHQVVFFVGDNGTGKSTLLEAIAYQSGFGVGGGDRSLDMKLSDASAQLASVMTLSWLPKISRGFFLRAETFFNFAKYLDELAHDPFVGPQIYNSYGGKSLNEQSHGEAFLSLFTNRFWGKSLYILDEPEAALSPQRQLAFLGIMKDLEDSAQFIIATHSPILMAYPGAKIYHCDEEGIRPIDYMDTEHYRLTKAFLDNPERFFKRLFDE